MKRALFLPFLCVALFAQDHPASGGKGVNFYSREKEAALGAQLAAESRRNTKLLESETVQRYIEQMGRRIAAQLPGEYSFTFATITDQVGGTTHEPIAHPGGYIFVPASLILDARSEAEFAGMLAHAMAHVTERHGTKSATRGELANIASVPLIANGNNPDATVPLGMLKLQRDFELQADAVAAGAMAKAGLDPTALKSYLERTQIDDPNRPAAFSKLPDRATRIRQLQNAAQPAVSYPASSDFVPIQEEVRRLTLSKQVNPPSLVGR